MRIYEMIAERKTQMMLEGEDVLRPWSFTEIMEVVSQEHGGQQMLDEVMLDYVQDLVDSLRRRG